MPENPPTIVQVGLQLHKVAAKQGPQVGLDIVHREKHCIATKQIHNGQKQCSGKDLGRKSEQSLDDIMCASKTSKPGTNGGILSCKPERSEFQTCYGKRHLLFQRHRYPQRVQITQLRNVPFPCVALAFGDALCMQLPVHTQGREIGAWWTSAIEIWTSHQFRVARDQIHSNSSSQLLGVLKSHFSSATFNGRMAPNQTPDSVILRGGKPCKLKQKKCTTEQSRPGVEQNLQCNELRQLPKHTPSVLHQQSEREMFGFARDVVLLVAVPLRSCGLLVIGEADAAPCKSPAALDTTT